MATDTGLLLTVDAMKAVDDAAIKSGTSGTALMDRAGQAAARLCQSLKGRGTARIFCGPGNNGGDGYVAAKYLHDAGWRVDLWSLVSPGRLKGDAAWAEAYCPLVPQKLSDLPAELTKTDIFIDALFGAGLNKELEPEISAMIEAGMTSANVSVAIDLPSGVSGGTGEDLSGVYTGMPETQAFDHSITFGAHKFGHALYPGKQICGKIWVADIGLSAEALKANASGQLNGAIALDGHAGLQPQPRDHKYHRGHVAIVCGERSKQGAGHLAAKAALSVGAGLVTALEREPLTGTTLPSAIMTSPWPAPAALDAFIAERKISCLVIGPGLGLDAEAEALFDAALGANTRLVLDADALTLIAKNGWQERMMGNMIATPHEGEFARLFPDVSGAKIERFNTACEQVKSVLCLKGPDTLIGQKGGAGVTINVDAPAVLATGGSGDVLAGVIAGVWPPGIFADDAARIAVRLHTLSAHTHGGILFADQLIDHLGDAIARYKFG